MDYEQILTESIIFIFFSFGGGILQKYNSVFIYTSTSSLELTDVYIQCIHISCNTVSYTVRSSEKKIIK